MSGMGPIGVAHLPKLKQPRQLTFAQRRLRRRYEILRKERYALGWRDLRGVYSKETDSNPIISPGENVLRANEARILMMKKKTAEIPQLGEMVDRIRSSGSNNKIIAEGNRDIAELLHWAEGKNTSTLRSIQVEELSETTVMVLPHDQERTVRVFLPDQINPTELSQPVVHALISEFRARFLPALNLRLIGQIEPAGDLVKICVNGQAYESWQIEGLDELRDRKGVFHQRWRGGFLIEQQ